MLGFKKKCLHFLEIDGCLAGNLYVLVRREKPRQNILSREKPRQNIVHYDVLVRREKPRQNVLSREKPQQNITSTFCF